MPTILCYNLSEDVCASYRHLCAHLGLSLRRVHPDEYALPIGALTGAMPVRPVPNLGGFDEAMLVFSDLTNAQLDAFLDAVRAGGLPRVPLKAIVTPTNIRWNSLMLRSELLREHMSLQDATGRG